MKWLIPLALLPFLVVGCASAEHSVVNDSKETVIQYEGADLHCVFTSYDRSASLTCDFVRFHQENPTLP